MKEGVNIGESKKTFSEVLDEIEKAILGQETIVEERTADGGTMTLTRKTANWRLVTECLLVNGYYVCCHFNEDSDTVNIEFRK